MEEIYDFEEERINLKQIYRQAAGKVVSRDFFIFACLEEEHTLKALKEESDLLLRWRFASDSQSKNQEGAEPSLEKDLRSLCIWYVENYPIMGESLAMDYEVCHKLVGAFALWAMDLNVYTRETTQKDLPKRVKADLAPLWILLDSLIKEYFPGYAESMIEFFEWKYSRPKETSYDLASLPPVGRYLSMLRQNDRSRERASYNSDRGEEKYPRPFQRDKPNFAGKDRPQSDKSGQGRREPKGRHDRDRGDGREKNKELEKERIALSEVEKAVVTLKNQTSMGEFRLKPQNSFIRRLQHKKVNDLGFSSTSVGEEDERAVLITREE